MLPISTWTCMVGWFTVTVLDMENRTRSSPARITMNMMTRPRVNKCLEEMSLRVAMSLSRIF